MTENDTPEGAQIIPQNHVTMEALGAAIACWADDEASRPGVLDPATNTLVMTPAEFNAALKQIAIDKNLDDTLVACAFRENVTRVEITQRQTDTFKIVLPEKGAIDLVNQKVNVPAIYAPIDYVFDAQDYQYDPAGPATFQPQIPPAKYETFLNLYMAGYTCGQCF